MQGLPGSRAIRLFALALVLALGAGFRAAGDAVLDVEAIAEQNRGAVVTLYGERDGNPEAVQSSGCCVDASGLFLTAAHAVKGLDRLRARFSDGTERTLSVLEADESRDMALLQSDRPAPKAATVGNADELKPGSPLVAISTPKGLNESVASGIVANINRVYLGRRVIQSDLALNEGSSGGPVFDREGRLVGIVRGRVNDVDKATLVAPVNDAYDLLRRHGLNPSAAGATFETLTPGADATAAEKQAIEEYNQGVAAVTLEEKIAHYCNAVVLKPELFEGWFNLGVAYSASKRPENAIRAYRRARSLRPSSLETQRNLGRALLDVNRLAEVEECFRKAVELAPADAGVHNDLGELYRRQGRLAEAVECFERALILRPDYAAAHYNIGLTFAAMERWDEAIDGFHDYLRLAPNAADAEEVRGMLTDLERKKTVQGKGNGGGS